MKFAICDDDINTIKLVNDYLIKYQIKYDFDFDIYTCQSIDELFKLSKETSFDLVFLDILFPQSNGIEFAAWLRDVEENFALEIVFISGSDEYYREVINYQAFGFLDKPFSYKGFEFILKKFFKSKSLKADIFSYEKSRKICYMEYSKIMYFMSSNRQVFIYGMDFEDSFYATLDSVEESLRSNDFIRIHQSYLVNINYIRKISLREVVLHNGELLPISSSYSKHVQDFIKERFGTN